jgi:1,4-alpha-glucan branching enzyme
MTGVERVIYGASLLTEHDIYLFRQGTHTRLYEKLGAHPGALNAVDGTHFAVWAPNAESVSVIGSFNDWRSGSHPLQVRADGSGIWEGFIPGVGRGALYKYHLQSRQHGYRVEKDRKPAAHGVGGMGPGLYLVRRRLDAAAGPSQHPAGADVDL